MVVDMRRFASTVDFHDRKYMQKVLTKTSGSADIGKKMEYFLSTGNLVSNTGLDLQQVWQCSGLWQKYRLGSSPDVLCSDIRIYCHCGKAQLLSLHLSLPLHPPWFFLRRTQNDHRPQIIARSMGIPLPSPHSWWFPMWSPQSPESFLPNCRPKNWCCKDSYSGCITWRRTNVWDRS